MDNDHFQDLMQKWLVVELNKVPQLKPLPEMYDLLQNRSRQEDSIFSRTRWYFAAAAMLLVVFLTVTNFEQIFRPVPPPVVELGTRQEVEEKEGISFDRSFKAHKKMGAPEALMESDAEEIPAKLIFEFQREGSFYATEVDMTQPLDYPIGLNSQDNYRISVEPGSDSYLYVFQLNSENILIKLFPDEDKGLINPVSASQKYLLPDEDKWYHLDQLTGEEKIYLYLNREESKELLEIYNKYSHSRSASKQTGRRIEIIQELENLDCEILILENQ